jgi:predicted Zn-dependent protease
VPARIALIAAALVAAACLTLTLRAIRLEAAARADLPAGRITAKGIAEAERHLRDAEKLNPDIRPLFLRGALLTGVNQPQRAVVVLREVLRREPDNAIAASLLVRNLSKFDRAGAAEAERRFREIAPRWGGD